MLIALTDSPSLRIWNYTNELGLAWQSNETSFCLFCSMIWSTQGFIMLSRNAPCFFFRKQPTWWFKVICMLYTFTSWAVRLGEDFSEDLPENVIGWGKLSGDRQRRQLVETLLFYLIPRILWDDSLLYSRSLRSFHVKCATNMANIKVYGLCKHVNKRLVPSDQIVRLGYARLSLEEVSPCWLALEFGSLSQLVTGGLLYTSQVDVWDFWTINSIILQPPWTCHEAHFQLKQHLGKELLCK